MWGRPPTSLDHLHTEGPEWSRESHFREWVESQNRRRSGTRSAAVDSYDSTLVGANLGGGGMGGKPWVSNQLGLRPSELSIAFSKSYAPRASSIWRCQISASLMWGRPPTSLDHLIRKHTEGPEWSRESHFREWVEMVNHKTGDALEPEARRLIHMNLHSPNEA